jgi:hypothetical protein
MLVLPIACFLGVAAGRLAGGRVRHLVHLHFRRVMVVVIAVALQLAVPWVPPGWRFALVSCSYAAVGAWLVANMSRRPSPLRLGLALVTAGWMLNFAVVMLNRGMPVSLDAARQVGAQPGFDVARGNFSKHVPLRSGTALAPLGDVIPVRALGTVVSAGDVAIFGGMVLVLAAGMAAVPNGGKRAAEDGTSTAATAVPVVRPG